MASGSAIAILPRPGHRRDTAGTSPGQDPNSRTVPAIPGRLARFQPAQPRCAHVRSRIAHARMSRLGMMYIAQRFSQ